MMFSILTLFITLFINLSNASYYYTTTKYNGNTYGNKVASDTRSVSYGNYYMDDGRYTRVKYKGRYSNSSKGRWR